MPTFTVTVTFTTDHNTDEHLRDEQAIADEQRSWLDSLRATVQTAVVREQTACRHDYQPIDVCTQCGETR